MRLEKGDKLFLYTDGIPETANKKREMIEYEDKLLSLFEKSNRIPLGQSLEDIIKKIAEFRDGADVTDDLLIIGFEIE
jgi:sigma-B regulation protein RsbU (phosphoserine phosphatase)